MGPVRMAVRIEGVVQGVGFRPFVHALATRLGLAGHVGNDASGVFAEVEGVRVAEFLDAVRAQAPPLAVIESVRAVELSPRGGAGFFIVASPAAGAASTLVSADSATCGACLRELNDPADRRFHAQPVCCPDRGPRLRLTDGVGELPGDPIASTVDLLAAGRVVAVKGLGGYHLAVDAAHASAAALLRARKHREDKPFAVMVPDLEGAETARSRRSRRAAA